MRKKPKKQRQIIVINGAKKKKKRSPKTTGKKVIVFNQGTRKGPTMDGRKKRKTRKARRHAGTGAHYSGMEGAPRKKSKRRGGRYMGGAMKGKDIQGMALDVLGIGAGVVASGYLGSMLPVKNLKLKAAIPALGGIALAATMKQPLVKHLGYGLAVAGIVSLARQFVPALPALAGVDETEAQLQMLGEETFEGAPLQLAAEDFDGEDDTVIDGGAGDDFDIQGVEDFDGVPLTMGQEAPFFTPANT